MADSLLERVHARTGDATWTLQDRHPFGRGEILKFGLHNGLTLLVLSDPESPVFAYHTWYRVGSRHEKQGRTGIAHLFEHMMFKATTNLPEGELDRLMERHGAQTNAATWVDWTYYHEVMPATLDNLDLCARVEADRMVNLVLNQSQLDSEREVVINERRYRVDDDPDGTMFEKLYALALDGHPYGWPTIGWLPDIEAISLDDCMDFYKRYYSPNNAVVIVVGNAPVEEVLVSVGQHYGAILPQDIPEEAVPADPVIDGPRRLDLRLPVQSDRYLAGWIGPAIDDPDSTAIDVAMEILFGGESGRLHRQLVTDLELASMVTGWGSSFTWPGLIEVAANAKGEHTAEQLEEVILKELANFAEHGPTEDEVDKARCQLEAALYRTNYAPNAVASKLGHYEATAGDYRRFFDAVEAVRTVTAEDVLRATRRFLQPSGRAVVVARPSGEAPADDDADGDEEDDA